MIWGGLNVVVKEGKLQERAEGLLGCTNVAGEGCKYLYVICEFDASHLILQQINSITFF